MGIYNNLLSCNAGRIGFFHVRWINNEWGILGNAWQPRTASEAENLIVDHVCLCLRQSNPDYKPSITNANMTLAQLTAILMRDLKLYPSLRNALEKEYRKKYYSGYIMLMLSEVYARLDNVLLPNNPRQDYPQIIRRSSINMHVGKDAQQCLKTTFALNEKMLFIPEYDDSVTSVKVERDFVEQFLENESRKLAIETAGLSSKEKEMLPLLLQGESESEIAVRTSSPLGSVRWRRTEIFRKIQLADKAIEIS